MAGLSLDELFKKTIAVPQLYWIPCSDQIVSLREEQGRNGHVYGRGKAITNTNTSSRTGGVTAERRVRGGRQHRGGKNKRRNRRERGIRGQSDKGLGRDRDRDRGEDRDIGTGDGARARDMDRGRDRDMDRNRDGRGASRERAQYTRGRNDLSAYGPPSRDTNTLREPTGSRQFYQPPEPRSGGFARDNGLGKYGPR